MKPFLYALLGVTIAGLAPACAHRDEPPASQSPQDTPDPSVRDAKLDTQIEMLEMRLASTEIIDPGYPQMLVRLARLHFEYRDFVVEQRSPHRRSHATPRRVRDQAANDMADEGIELLRIYVDELFTGPTPHREELLTMLVAELDRQGRRTEADRYRLELSDGS